MTFLLAIDLWFAQLMLSLRAPFFVSVFEGVTFFGSVLAIISIAGLVALFLLFSPRRQQYLAGLVTAIVGAAATGYALKELVARARPDGLIPAIAETGFSFPSGHSAASMAFYGFLAFLIFRLYPEYRKAALLIAAGIIILIGFSRLYLGVHYLSDVLAGYALGALWLFIGIRLADRLRSSDA